MEKYYKFKCKSATVITVNSMSAVTVCECVCVCVCASRHRPDVRHQRIHVPQHHRCDVSKDEGRRRPNDQRRGQEAETLLEPPHGRLRVCVCLCVCSCVTLSCTHTWTWKHTLIQSRQQPSSSLLHFHCLI